MDLLKVIRVGGTRYYSFGPSVLTQIKDIPNDIVDLNSGLARNTYAGAKLRLFSTNMHQVVIQNNPQLSKILMQYYNTKKSIMAVHMQNNSRVKDNLLFTRQRRKENLCAG